MGQKINPNGFRLPVTRNWTSRWYAVGRNFSRTLGEDLKVRSFLEKKLKNASVGRILIERPANNARITIYTARPGIVIGKQGADIEVLKAEVQKMMGVPVHVDIEEIRRPDLCAKLVAESITRTEWYREGRVPLQTLRANIDYGFAEAHTTYGVVGVKVWIYKGDDFGVDAAMEPAPEREGRRGRRNNGDRPARTGARRGSARRNNEAEAAAPAKDGE